MKKLAGIIALLLIFMNMSGCKKQKTIEETVRTIEELNTKIAELEKELVSIEEPFNSNKNHTTNTENLEELLNKLPNINTLEEIIDEYTNELDGAYAEGYGYRLYELYFKEGLDGLISILKEKDISTIKGIINLLFGELIIQENFKEIDEIRDYINNMELQELDDREKYIMYLIFAETNGKAIGICQ